MWINFCCQDENFDPRKSFICMEHFSSEDFSNELQYNMGFAARRHLNRGVVPSIKKLNEEKEKLFKERKQRLESIQNEETVGLIRSKGGLHDHLDQLEFRYRLRSYILGHNEGILSRSRNVEVDETPDIARSEKSLTGIIFSIIHPVMEDEEEVCHDLSDLKYDGLEHLAGYICSRFKDDIPGIIQPRDPDNKPTTSAS